MMIDKIIFHFLLASAGTGVVIGLIIALVWG